MIGFPLMCVSCGEPSIISNSAWYGRLSARLHHLGFISSKADTLFFIFTQHGVQICMLVSINDFVIPGSTPAANDRWLNQDTGTLPYFLGLKASYNSGAY
jgi:hypothetical protein